MGWIHVLLGVMAVCQALSIPRAVSEPRVDNAPRFLSPPISSLAGRFMYKIGQRYLSIGRAGPLSKGRYGLLDKNLKLQTTFTAGMSNKILREKEADVLKVKQAVELMPSLQLVNPISLTQDSPDAPDGVVLQVPGIDFDPTGGEMKTFEPYSKNFESDVSGQPLVAFTEIRPSDEVLFVRGTRDPGKLGDGLKGSRWSAMMNGNTRQMLAAFIAGTKDERSYSEHDYRMLTAVFYEWNKFEYLAFYKVCSDVKGALGFAAAQDRGDYDEEGKPLQIGSSPAEAGRRDLPGGHNQFLILNKKGTENVFDQFQLIGKINVEKVQKLLEKKTKIMATNFGENFGESWPDLAVCKKRE